MEHPYPKPNLSYPLPKKLIIWAKAHKNSRLPTQLIIFSGFLGKNIKNCPPSKLFLFTSLVRVGRIQIQWGNQNAYICRARHFMQLHILQCKSPFCLHISLFAFFAKLLKFSRKFEKWSCEWCKSAVKHKFRFHLDTLLKNFFSEPYFTWQKWQNFQTIKKYAPGLTFCTIFLSNCRKSLFIV